MSFSTVSANQTLDLFLRGIAPPLPESVFVSLHTADPGATGANEVTGAQWPDYARQDSAAGGSIADAWTAAAGGQSQNTRQMLFPANDGAAPVVITHFAIWDALAGGRCTFGGPLGTPRTIYPEDELVIYSGMLTVSTLGGA